MTFRITVLMILMCVALTARGLTMARRQLIPGSDEVAYLDAARGFAANGGVLATVRAYYTGHCFENTRNPFYLLMLTPFMRMEPADFARGKLVNIVLAMVLVVAVFLVTSRRWGESIGLAAAALVAFSPMTAHLSAEILADLLFALIYFLALMVLLRNDDRLRSWIGFGALVGCAYLTKGHGPLLFVAAVLSGCWRQGWRFFVKPGLYAAAATFVVVASMLFVRDWLVWHTFAHNFNAKIFWLDKWSDYFFLSASPEWDRVGLRWFLERHTFASAAARYVGGLRAVSGLTVMAASVGPQARLISLFSGCTVLALAFIGFRTAWRSNHRHEVIVIGGMAAFLFLFFSFNAACTDDQWRYVYPIVVSMFPMAAIGARDVFKRFSKAAVALPAACAFVSVIFIAANAESFQRSPLTYAAVPDFWSQTSTWINANIGSGEILVNSNSRYSLWDCCRDRRRSFPYEIPADTLKRFVESVNVHYALVDQSITQFDLFPEKYGASDDRGPVTFLGWPRCFHDTLTPSAFLVYSAVCAESRR